MRAWAQKAAAVAAAGALALGAGGAYVAGSGTDEAAAAAPAIAAAADPPDSSPSTIPVESTESPAMPGAPEKGPTPPPVVVSVDPGDKAEVSTGPGCVGTDLELADAGTVSLDTDGLSLARQSRTGGGDERRPESDDDRQVETLGGVLSPNGFDGDSEPASIDVDLDLGDLAARMALAADMAGGGLDVGVDVSGDDTASSPDCGAGGVSAGLDLSADDLRSP
jgi:hypothetical protein